ncbi:MAG: zinc ribbon domain-containing protein [Actinobacteria bacterium]|nr:zinc ribbon domain-containing protein [Actinomycetota bacterium]
MSDYAFYSLSEAGLPRGIELLPLPVRRQSEAAIFGGDEVRVDLLPEELIFFMAEYPNLQETYGATLSSLTWLVGVKEGLTGNTEAAARHLEAGLRADPSNLLLRSNYALMLQLLDRKDEAAKEYQTVFADPEGLKNPMVRLLAARLYGEMERYQEAYELLEPMAGERLGDNSYWDLLAAMKERAGIIGEGERVAATAQRPTQLPTRPTRPPGSLGAPGPTPGGKGLTCPQCGTPLQPHWKFCMGCGGSAEMPQPQKAFCIFCGAQIERGQPFCDSCGRKT